MFFDLLAKTTGWEAIAIGVYVLLVAKQKRLASRLSLIVS